MFNLRLKYDYRNKRYTLRKEEDNTNIRTITYSNKDIIRDITSLPMLSTIVVSMLFGNIYCGIVFGIIHLLVVLCSVLEKE